MILFRPFSIVAFAAVLSFVGVSASAEGLRRPVRWSNGSSVLSVLDFGGVGDGIADETGAFRRGLEFLGNAHGGILLVPRGQYRFSGVISVPRGVTLEGIYTYVPSHASQAPTENSVLLPTAGRGKEGDPPFIQLHANTALRGFVIYYPDQVRAGTPVPYPYAISMEGDNACVENVELLNPYLGIRAVNAARHMIRNVQGQPLRLGIYVDQTYDIGRIENVHFNPWYSVDKRLMAWQLTHAEAFMIARTDWQVRRKHSISLHRLLTHTDGSMGSIF